MRSRINTTHTDAHARTHTPTPIKKEGVGDDYSVFDLDVGSRRDVESEPDVEMTLPKQI